MSKISLQPREGRKYSWPSRCDDLFSPPTSSSYICDYTMSFGYSVGDFLALFNLLNTVRKQFVDAPAQFKAISNE